MSSAHCRQPADASTYLNRAAGTAGTKNQLADSASVALLRCSDTIKKAGEAPYTFQVRAGTTPSNRVAHTGHLSVKSSQAGQPYRPGDFPMEVATA